VVAVGLTVVEPLEDVEVKLPGEMEREVAPLVAQVSVLLVPELMLAGLAENEEMEGVEPGAGVVPCEVAAQPARATEAASNKRKARGFRA